MSKRRLTVAAIILTAVSTMAYPALGQSGEGAVQRDLDKPFNMKLGETTITAALAEISSRTGIPINLAEGTLARLPHGEETRLLRINAADVKLRKALDAILTPLALEWAVSDNGSIIVRPTPELIRMNHRPTFAETNILFALADTRMVRGKKFLDQAREAAGRDELKLDWQVGDAESRAAAVAAADGRMPCNGFQYLHRLCQNRGWTWYLSGTDIIILSEEMQAARQLGRTLTVTYQRQPLLVVLQDLARRADLGLKMDPGVLTNISDQAKESFSLVVKDATVDEALQQISGATGLTFKTDGLNIRVGGSEAQAARGTVRKRPEFLVGMPVTDKDGTQYIIIMPPGELSDELVERIRHLKAEKLGQPASAPAAHANVGAKPAAPE